MDVKLYIEATHKGLRPKDARYGYILACQTSVGLVTSAGAGRAEADYPGLALMAVRDAMERMRRPEKICIITDCANRVSAILEGWLESWRVSDWKNSRGREINNRNLWENLYELTQVYEIDVEYQDKHEFSQVLLAEISMAAVEPGQKIRLNALETRRNTK